MPVWIAGEVRDAQALPALASGRTGCDPRLRSHMSVRTRESRDGGPVPNPADGFGNREQAVDSAFHSS